MVGIRWNHNSHHKLVTFPEMHMNILCATHNEVTHKGYFAMSTHIAECFLWPNMLSDITWFVKTCLLCQLRQTQQILILPTVPLPVPLFAKMHMDTMHLPTSGGFKYIVQGCCTLSHWPEFMQRWYTHWVNGSTKTSFVGGEHSLRSSPTMGLHLSKLVNNCWKSTTLIISIFQDTIRRQTVLSSDLTSTYDKPCSKWLWVTSHAGVSPHTLSFGQTA